MKLEEIEKKNIFEVPDGYFDKLPQVIQSRVAVKEKSAFAFPMHVFNFKYAFPILLVAVASVFLYKNYYTPSPSASQVLESVSSETLIAYLGESEISEEEIIQSINFNSIGFKESFNQTIESIDLTKTDIDNLSKNIENEYF